MKKTLFSFCWLSVASSQVFADTSNDYAPTKKVCPAQKRSNPSARPPLTYALDLFVVGEGLLWQASEENLTYAARTDETHSFNDLKTVDFRWDFGFRVGLGYNAPRDGWDFSLMWTHIGNHAEGKQTAHLNAVGMGDGNDDFVNPIWSVDNIATPGILKKAEASWNVHLEQVDFGLGREYYAGKHLTLRPNAGLRSAWIYQDYTVDYDPFVSSQLSQKIEMTNRYFGLGFFGGLDTDWMLGRGFSIYSLADFALLMGYFDVNQYVLQPPTKGDLDTSFRAGRAVLDLSLGLKWCRLFGKKAGDSPSKQGMNTTSFLIKINS